MKPRKAVAVLMALMLMVTMLPSMVSAAEPAALLEGKLKMKGTAQTGETLSADFAEVLPAGITDEDVSFLWGRRAADGPEDKAASPGDTELGREKTYKVAAEDAGSRIVLTVTGLSDRGYAGSLTVLSETVKDAEAAEDSGDGEPAETEESTRQEAEVSMPEEDTIPDEEESSQDGYYDGEGSSQDGYYGGEGSSQDGYYVEDTLPEEGNTPDGDSYTWTAEEWDPEDLSAETGQEDEELYRESEGDSGEAADRAEDDEYAGYDGDEAAGGNADSDMEVENGLFPVTSEDMYTSDAGGEEPQEEGVSAVAVLEGGADVMDFGTVQPGSEEAQYVTVRNNGSETLFFEGISPDYFMVQDIVEPLEPGEEIRLWVQPREGLEAGMYEDTITYISAEGAEASFRAAVTIAEEETPGDPEGGDPENTDPPQEGPSVSQTADISLSLPEIAFPALAEGYVPSAQTVTVTNNGAEAVSLHISADEAGEFTVDAGEFPESLDAGSTGSFSVSPVAGLEEGTYTGSILIMSGEETAAAVAVSFTVTAPYTYTLSVQPETLEFGSAQEGYAEAPAAQIVTLENTGTGDITLQPPMGTDEFKVNVMAEFDTQLAAGETTTFSVQPEAGLAAGSYTGEIAVSGEDGTSYGKVTASFTVTPKPVYKLAVSPDSLNFGAAEVGNRPEAQTVTVTNQGNVTVNLQQPGSSGEYFVTGSLSSVTLEPGASAAFTVRPAKGLKEGIYSEEIHVNTDTEADASVMAIFQVTPQKVRLEGITKPGDISGLPNATAKDVNALGLPSTVTIRTSTGEMKANVAWDVQNCSYNPGSTSAQNFSVSGRVTLPEGIENPDNISLVTSVNVGVNGYSPRLASAENNYISGITSGAAYTTQSRISFTAVGAGMDNSNPRQGDTRYVPKNWAVVNTYSWEGSPYSATFGMAQAGQYTLKVTFEQQQYNGSGWVSTGSQDTKQVSFSVASATVTAVPGQNLTPAANRRSAVKTGDDSPILPLVAALVVAVLAIGGIVIYKKKQK